MDLDDTWWGEVYRFAGLIRGNPWLSNWIKGAEEDMAPRRRVLELRCATSGGRTPIDPWPDAGDVYWIYYWTSVTNQSVQSPPESFLHEMRFSLPPHHWAGLPEDVRECLGGRLTSLFNDPLYKEQAVAAVGSMREGAASLRGVPEALLPMLKDANADVAHSAGRALANLGSAASEVDGVMEGLVGLMKDGSAEVRARALEVVGDLGQVSLLQSSS